MQNTFIK